MGAKSKTLVFILISFLLGGVAGGFIGAKFLGARWSNRPAHARVLQEFTKRLNLQGNQPATIDSILEAHRMKFGEIRKQYSETFRSHRDTLRREIRKMLTAEQNVLFDQYIKEMDEREANSRKDAK